MTTPPYPSEDARRAALVAFAKSLQDVPLDPAVPADAKLYVKELHAVSPETDRVARLCRSILQSEGSRVWLFTGNLGSGKSTELRRLRRDLSASGCVVLLADALDYINPGRKVEIGDFLLSVTAAIAEQAGELLGDAQLESSYWERVRNYLTRTRFEITEATPAGQLKLDIRQDPTAKERLQNHLRGHITTLVEELEDFRAGILQRIREHHGDHAKGDHAKIVILLDSLELLRGSGDADDEVFSSVKTLFTQYPRLICLHDIQVVYSVAPYLIHLAQQIVALFGERALSRLTTAHVFKTRSRDLDLGHGVTVVRRIIAQRYPDWERILPESVLDRLIEASGGDLRDLFRLLSIVLLELDFYDDVDRATDYALAEVRRNMTWLTEPQRERLRYLARYKQPRLNDDADRDALVHDLEAKRVFMYSNGEDWFDIHPLLRDLVEGEPGAAVPGHDG
jgi:hypothetical protein